MVSSGSHPHTRDGRRQLCLGLAFSPTAVPSRHHEQHGVLVQTHVDSVFTGALGWWDPSATKLSSQEVPFTIKCVRLAQENR